MFISAFVNIGIILILVNMNVGKETPTGSRNPFLQGIYINFSTDWYRFIGTTLAFTMFLNIFTWPIANLASWIISVLQRWYDRGYSFSNNKCTRVMTSPEYIKLHQRSGFAIDIRYAGLLTTFGVTFLFSAGMPILYPIAAGWFAVNYWVDKFLLVYVNRVPD